MLRIAWHPLYNHPLPEGHRFPMEKYDLIPEQLLREGTITESQLFQPTPLAEAQILRCHIPQYWQKLKDLTLSPAEIRRTGFPLTASLIQREITIMGGTVQAVHYAKAHGAALNIAGGTHHAFTDRGEGYCLLNDLALAAYHALTEHLATRVLIIDLDVHQGNGTAQICRQHPSIYTFSMHGRHNYPIHKEQSTLDIPLEDHTTDTTYLNILSNHLPAIIDTFQPDLLIYQCGVDVLATDRLGRLSLTRDACRQRDHFVFFTARNYRIPIIASMGGGYSPRLSDVVEAHVNTFRVAQEIFA